MLCFDNEELWVDGEAKPVGTCEPLERINTWLSPYRLVSLVESTYEGEVGHRMDANLYGGGFKHFDIDGFILVVKDQDWKVRSKVQMWIKGAEEGMGTESFTLIKLGRRRSSRSTRPPSASSGMAPSTRQNTKGGAATRQLTTRDVSPPRPTTSPRRRQR